MREKKVKKARDSKRRKKKKKKRERRGKKRKDCRLRKSQVKGPYEYKCKNTSVWQALRTPFSSHRRFEILPRSLTRRVARKVVKKSRSLGFLQICYQGREKHVVFLRKGDHRWPLSYTDRFDALHECRHESENESNHCLSPRKAIRIKGSHQS